MQDSHTNSDQDSWHKRFHDAQFGDQGVGECSQSKLKGLDDAEFRKTYAGSHDPSKHDAGLHGGYGGLH